MNDYTAAGNREPIESENTTPLRWLATYRGTGESEWGGEVADLGISVTSTTLSDTRSKLERRVEEHYNQMSATNWPADQPPSTISPNVAETMIVRLSPGREGTRDWVSISSAGMLSTRRNPYQDEKGTLEILPSIVLVIDEIGASARMADQGLNTELLTTRAELLAAARAWLADPAAEDIESLNYYTDNLVYGLPLWSHADAVSRLGLTVTGAAHYQLHLALQGIATRGGMTLGDHHQGSSIIIGPALIEAHKIETRIAKYPRVVLSDVAVRCALLDFEDWSDPRGCGFYGQLLVDQRNGSVVFISYLSATDDYDNQNQRVNALRIHRRMILHSRRSVPRPGARYRDIKEYFRRLAKWNWLAEYHDFYVKDQRLPTELLTRRHLPRRPRFAKFANVKR